MALSHIRLSKILFNLQKDTFLLRCEHHGNIDIEDMYHEHHGIIIDTEDTYHEHHGNIDTEDMYHEHHGIIDIDT